MNRHHAIISGYAKIPITKNVWYRGSMHDLDIEDICMSDINNIINTSIMEKEDEIEFEDLEIGEGD